MRLGPFDCLPLYINSTWRCHRNFKRYKYWRRIKIIYGTPPCNRMCLSVYVCGSVLSLFTPLSQRTVKRWAVALQAGNSVIAFSVPEAGLPALNQKRQSLSVMAQLIIKHVPYLCWAPPIYFHLSDRDGCTNSISTINTGSINISPLSPKTNHPAHKLSCICEQ